MVLSPIAKGLLSLKLVFILFSRPSTVVNSPPMCVVYVYVIYSM